MDDGRRGVGRGFGVKKKQVGVCQWSSPASSRRLGVEKPACRFEEVMETTPEHLKDAGLYNEIAMNLAGGPWRTSGLAKLAREISREGD